MSSLWNVVKALVLITAGLYAVVLGFLGLFAAAASGWGAAVLLGSLTMIVGVFVSWTHVTSGGLLVLFGGIAGAAGFGLSAVVCIGGCETYTAHDEIAVSITVGLLPVVIGLCWILVGLCKERRAVAHGDSEITAQ
jgi:hypothetical protein